MVVCCVFVGLMPWASFAIAQPAPLTIRGRVVADDNERPLRRALVTSAGGGDRRVRPVLTGGDGRFEIQPPDSAAALTVAKAGYASTRFTLRRSSAASDRELVVRLPRGGVISGRVIDSNAQSAIGSRVVARLDDASADGAHQRSWRESLPVDRQATIPRRPRLAPSPGTHAFSMAVGILSLRMTFMPCRFPAGSARGDCRSRKNCDRGHARCAQPALSERSESKGYCPTPYRWPIVLSTMRPSEMAGVAMIASFMSFLAICFMSGVAEMTYTSPSSLAM
jgi:hypothetical protein